MFNEGLGKFFLLSDGKTFHVLTWDEFTRDWITKGFDVVGVLRASSRHEAQVLAVKALRRPL